MGQRRTTPGTIRAALARQWVRLTPAAAPPPPPQPRPPPTPAATCRSSRRTILTATRCPIPPQPPQLPRRPRCCRRPRRRDLPVQRLRAVVLRNGQLPQLLLQVPRPELAFGHQRSHRCIQRVTVDDSEQVVRFLNTLAVNPEQRVVNHRTVVLKQCCSRHSRAGIHHAHGAPVGTALPFQL